MTRPVSILLLGFVALAGCNRSELVSAGGTVTQGKVPVSGATVLLHYPGGESAVGVTDAAGRYSLTFNGQGGTRPGTKIGVTVTKYEATSQNQNLPPRSGPPEPGQDSPTPKGMPTSDPPKNLLPAEYGDLKNPKLTFDVPADGSDELDIHLP